KGPPAAPRTRISEAAVDDRYRAGTCPGSTVAVTRGKGWADEVSRAAIRPIGRWNSRWPLTAASIAPYRSGTRQSPSCMVGPAWRRWSNQPQLDPSDTLSQRGAATADGCGIAAPDGSLSAYQAADEKSPNTPAPAGSIRMNGRSPS